MNIQIKHQIFSILILSLIICNEISSQSIERMEDNYIILKDELPITEGDIERFEKKRNIKLPQDYRDFILKFNGGVVD